MTAPPREPTPTMLGAGAETFDRCALTNTPLLGAIWRAMYDAAPAPPVAQPAEPVLPCLERGCPNLSLMPESEYCRYHAARQPAEPPATDDLVEAMYHKARHPHIADVPAAVNEQIDRMNAQMDSMRSLIKRQAWEIAQIRACNATGDAALAEVVAERDALRECVRGIVEVYDHYRRRGVAPAPVEYADVVRAIDAARAKVETL